MSLLYSTVRLLPSFQELEEMWLCLRAQEFAYTPELSQVFVTRETATYEVEAQENKIGVQDVRFAIVSDQLDVSVEIGLPNLVAAHAELARRTEQCGDRLQADPCTRLIQRQGVHQIEMAGVKAIQVIVEAKCRILIARVRVARRGDPTQQRTIMQHGKVEARAVPRHQVRRVTLDAIEEALNDLRFRGRRIAQ